MFDWIRNAFRQTTRNLNIQQLRQFVYGPPTIAGVAMSEELALSLTAVWRAIDLKSSTVAGLDVEVYQDKGPKGIWAQPRHWVTELLNDPNDDQNANKFWSTFLMHFVAAPDAFAEIERDTQGRPIALHNIHWRNCKVMQDEAGNLFYRLNREGRDVPPADMIHCFQMSWNGMSGIGPITAARETLGTSVAADRHAGSVFGNGGVPAGFLKVADKPNPDIKLSIREAWDAIHGGPANGNKVGILFAGTEWVETNMSPADAQLLQTRAFHITEIARIFNVPPNLLFASEQSSYNANEENNLAFYEFGLRPLIDKLQAELTFKLLPRPQRQAGFAIRYRVEDKFPRATVAKSNTARQLVLSGLITQNEGREMLGMNPIEGADSLLVPTNLSIISEGGKETTNAQLTALPSPLSAE